MKNTREPGECTSPSDCLFAAAGVGSHASEALLRFSSAGFLRQRFPPLRGVREGRAHQQTLPILWRPLFTAAETQRIPHSLPLFPSWFFFHLSVERDESLRVQSARDIFLRSLISASRPPFTAAQNPD